MEKHQTAVIVGTGFGLGCALARRFARAEMNVALASRNPERIDGIASECCGVSHRARAYGCDATDEAAVASLFTRVADDMGEPDLVVYNAGTFVRASIVDTTADEFERCWRVGAFGGFLVGREAARRMLPRGCGTVLFTGATASLRGGALFHNLAVGKFGLRALAQSMARELQPQGIHVAHVVIDGRIRPSTAVEHSAEAPPNDMLEADAIAETYYQIHRQPRNAWTLETDLRPWVEKF